jgi:hypothetical protein
MIRAYHFTEGWKLRDGQPLKVGKTYTYDGPLEICRSGYHASVDILNCLDYAPGSVLSLVKCDGKIIEGEDKLVCSSRKVIASKDVAIPLHWFAIWCARSVQHLMKDPRSIAAIDAKEAWLRGGLSDDMLLKAQWEALAAAEAARAAVAAAAVAAEAALAEAAVAAEAVLAEAEARQAQRTELIRLLSEDWPEFAAWQEAI